MLRHRELEVGRAPAGQVYGVDDGEGDLMAHLVVGPAGLCGGRERHTSKLDGEFGEGSGGSSIWGEEGWDEFVGDNFLHSLKGRCFTVTDALDELPFIL